MNLWKTIHRKLIDEPIERLVGWPSFANGSLAEKNTSDGLGCGNATGSDEWQSAADEDQMNNMNWPIFGWENSNQLLDDDGSWPK